MDQTPAEPKAEQSPGARPLVLDALRLRDVIDAWDEGMQIFSPEFRYLYINEAAARHGRRTREELYGRTLLECYPGVETTEMFAVLQRCMREHSSAMMENQFEYPDGSRAWFDLRIKPCPEGLIILSLARSGAAAQEK
jgi:PAS domain S-box-containing protein